VLNPELNGKPVVVGGKPVFCLLTKSTKRIKGIYLNYNIGTNDILESVNFPKKINEMLRL